MSENISVSTYAYYSISLNFNIKFCNLFLKPLRNGVISQLIGLFSIFYLGTPD